MSVDFFNGIYRSTSQPTSNRNLLGRFPIKGKKTMNPTATILNSASMPKSLRAHVVLLAGQKNSMGPRESPTLGCEAKHRGGLQATNQQQTGKSIRSARVCGQAKEPKTREPRHSWCTLLPRKLHSGRLLCLLRARKKEKKKKKKKKKTSIFREQPRG